MSGFKPPGPASGSELSAVAAIRAGASTVTGADIDAFAAAAIELNARANGYRCPAS
jgi:predicted nicotinamide N-methyase